MHSNIRTLLAEKGSGAIPGLLLSSSLRLLVLAPHPDDFDAIGVTLKFFLQNGNSLDVGVVRTGSGVEDTYRTGLTASEKAEIRESEQRASLKFFGLPEHCLTWLSMTNDTDEQLRDDDENCSAIGDFVLEKAPDIVFLPHGNDTNRAHRVMYSFFRQAAERCSRIRPIAAFLNRDPKTVEMRTDVYMPFGGEQAIWKAELLRFHDSQQQRNMLTRGQGFDERILNLDRKTASELSITEEYAEAFEIEFYNPSIQKS